MIRIGKGIAGTLSAVALSIGTCGAAWAQSTTQPSDTPEHSGTSRTPTGSRGVTAPQGTTSTKETKETAQERFDREKVTLKDQLQAQINAANANIDTLKKMSDADKGTAKKRDDDMEKRLSDLRDALQKDQDKIDKASLNDWNGVHPVVTRDLNAMGRELRTAENVTKIPVPRTGAANKQPSGTEPQQPTPAPSENK